ncbi:Protein of unknown function [Gryllus bimaculatus]|nr:Protein of unknown function [Gryllus bimaculatus]
MPLHEEKKRFAMFYPSELWQQYGTSVFPEARFYRKIKDKAIGFSPHACSRRDDRNIAESEIRKCNCYKRITATAIVTLLILHYIS